MDVSTFVPRWMLYKRDQRTLASETPVGTATGFTSDNVDGGVPDDADAPVSTADGGNP